MHCHLSYPNLLISVTYLWYLLAILLVRFCCLLAKYVWSIVYITTDIVSGFCFILITFNPHILLTANQLSVPFLASTSRQQVPCFPKHCPCCYEPPVHSVCNAIIYSHLSPSKAIISPSFASDCARSLLSWTRLYSLMNFEVPSWLHLQPILSLSTFLPLSCQFHPWHAANWNYTIRICYYAPPFIAVNDEDGNSMDSCSAPCSSLSSSPSSYYYSESKCCPQLVISLVFLILKSHYLIRPLMVFLSVVPAHL